MDDTNQQIKVKAFKVILVGIQSVGKSSILQRLINSQFLTHYQATVGIDYHTYVVKVGEASYSLQIWDTAGQQKFKSLTSTYYKNSSGCICVYDINDRETLQKTDYYLEKALEENIPKESLFLVGNKRDLGEGCINEGQEKAKKYEVQHFETSAMNGEGIDEMFNTMGLALVGKFGGNPSGGKNVELLPAIQIKEGRPQCKC